ncbi:MAG: tetratricopeptide repeat protein, partial [Planctomycetes bacterium]|nr:tetratricopeptide repeat protein [Planctomycetota bacterium]
YTRDGGTTWVEANVGLTRDANNPDATPEFPFYASDDGEYGFLYRLKGQTAPDIDTKPILSAWVDTTAPSVQVIAPVDGQYLKAGDPVVITYRVDDPNIDSDKGLTIKYSTDGGRNYTEVVTGAAVTGSYTWNHALKSETDLWLYVEVFDRVGNSMPIQRQRLKVGQAEAVRKADRPYITFSGPLYGKEKSDFGKIYFEETDFYFTVDNRTGSPTEMVMLWYTIDGKNWVTGGIDTSGEDSGKITVKFPDQMRRNQLYGNFQQIGFYYQVISKDGTANKPAPTPTSPKDATFMVDTDGPHLGLLAPLPGSKLYKRKIPNNEDSGKLTITWAGVDRNPVPFVTDSGHERGPVRIQWRVFGSAETKDWQTLAHSLPLKGSFVVENDLPAGKVEFMVTATDQMGNETMRLSRPVEIIDATGYSVPVKGLAHLDSDRIWGKGVSLYRAGKYEDAIAEFDKALKIVPADKKNALLHDRALAVYRTGKINDAVRQLTKIIGLEEDNLTYRFSLASIHYKSGQRDQARAHLLKIVPTDSEEPHVKARSMLASIENDRGNVADAKKQWEFVEKHASKSSDEYRDAQAQLKLLASKAAAKPEAAKKE